MTKIAGSGSGSISQRHGSVDPDPPQNVMDPQHCSILINEDLPGRAADALGIYLYGGKERDS